MTSKLSDFTPDKGNANKGTQRGLKALDTSLRQYGAGRSILVDKNGKIIAGNKTAERAADLGIDDVIVVQTDGNQLVAVQRTDLDLDSEDGKARALATYDNRSGQLDLDWDIDALSTVDVDVLKDLWTVDELDELGIHKPVKDAIPDLDHGAELREKYGVETGQLWKIEKHRLICGDTLDNDAISKLMGKDTIKMLFTSPPYNMAGDMYKHYADNLKSEEYINFNLQTIEKWKSYLRGYLFWNLSYNKNARWEFIEIIYKIVKDSGLRFLELIVWDKGHGLPITSKDMLTRNYEDILLMADEITIHNELELYGLLGTERKAYFNKEKLRGITNYWRIGTSNTQINGHLACFPVQLPIRAMELASDIGDIIADPFCGSGTTIVACQNLGRKCRAIEISPEYCAVTLERMATAFPGIEIERM
jgi:DNA modification methylase